MKRRNFLKNSSFAALSSAAVTNTLLNLKLMSNSLAQASSSGDYKALVCIMLGGGNDSFNMLVPTRTSEYNNYANVRAELALPKPGNNDVNALLALDINRVGGREFGVHSGLPKLRDRVGEGNATFIANLGSLVEKVSVAEIKSGGARVPRALYSHNDQQTTWQTAAASESSSTGWGGRLADKLLAEYANEAKVSMNVSLAGNKLFLVGNQVASYSIGPDGASILTGTGLTNITEDVRSKTTKKIADNLSENILMNAFDKQKKVAFAEAEDFSSGFDSADLGANGDTFGNSNLDKDLKAVAKTIASRQALQLDRQIFFVSLGGFDHHNNMFDPVTGHKARLSELDNALDSFWNFMKENQLQDKVTVFTASDFGRTLAWNGAGSDHAWAGNSIVMGGAVKQRLVADGVATGSTIYGSYPTAGEFQKGSGLDVGNNGRLMPTTAIDEYFAELALWFGLPPSELENVFPNITSFYNYSPTQNPVGFLPT